MINKVVYTYYTDYGNNLKQGFRNDRAFLAFFQDSVEQSLLFFDQVQIYTDKEGEAFLIENGVDQGMIILFNFYSTEWDKRYWNFPKLMVYNHQIQPFLHLDLDAKLMESPSEKLRSSEVLCEKVRVSQILAYQRMNLSPEYSNKYDPQIPCSGLLGGNNLEVFKELYELAREVVTRVPLMYEVDFNMLVNIEEVLLKILCNDNKLTIEELGKDSYIHLQGQMKLSV